MLTMLNPSSGGSLPVDQLSMMNAAAMEGRGAEQLCQGGPNGVTRHRLQKVKLKHSVAQTRHAPHKHSPASPACIDG